MRFKNFANVQRISGAKLGLGLGLASLTSATWLLTGEREERQDNTKPEGDDVRLGAALSRKYRDRYRFGSAMLSCPSILATSAAVNTEETAAETDATDGVPVDLAPEEVKTMEYDFIVLGNGNAGLSALLTLRENCPSAKIALVDPLRPVSSTTKKLDYWPHFATGFDPVSRTVQLSDDTHQLRYRHGILVATGARGAPPPPSLLDEETMDRILELRSTSCPSSNRPIMSPKTVRQMMLLAASQGATIGVMGSGWEAIELAVAAAIVGSKAPMLTFGSAGPLSHVLPRYLSTALTKRLRQQGVDIQPRSLVRYVATDNQKQSNRLEVHTAKSYDMLDTKRTPVDLLVLAPYIDGPCGTAVIPTFQAPKQLEPFVMGQPWFQSWSQMTSPPAVPSVVVCFNDDARIMVNAELQGASGVFAAGSCAKYPDSTTGRARVAGEGSEDGAKAGRMAALHMAANYIGRGRDFFSRDETQRGPVSFAVESFPVLRSNLCSYLHGDSANTSYLADIGVTALCVGNCDSERMATHGFWWTNQSAQRIALEQTEEITPRRRTTRRRTRVSLQRSPVYGIGIVYYFDRKGRIRGIMAWGLPATSGGKEPQEALVSRMKDVIRTNGGISQWEAEENAFLHSFHLSEESKKLVGMSVSKVLSRRNTSGNIQRLMVPVENIPNPLHRYTAAKPSSITGLQTLKRKDHSQGDMAGENLYVNDEDYSLRPPTLMYVFPMHSPRQTSDMSSGVPFHQSDQERLHRALQENEQRARPPKEEPLWLRRGDARRSTSQADLLADIIARNISKGRFADGSDALQQAPTPKSVQSAKEIIANWMGSDDSGGGGSEDDLHAEETGK